MKTIAVVLLATGCSMPVLACDQVDAARLQSTLAEAGATWSDRGGAVRLEWGRVWDGAAPAQRLALLRAFAEGDACLAGQPRVIVFERNGKAVGSASPRAGVRLIEEPAPAVAASAACP